VARTAGPTATPATPKGATRLVVPGQEADVTIEGVGLTFAVTGGTG
jgi:hypothetical protein